MDGIKVGRRGVLIQAVQQEKQGAAGLVLGAEWTETWLCTRPDGRTYANWIFRKRQLLIISQELSHFRLEIVTTDLLALMLTFFWED